MKTTWCFSVSGGRLVEGDRCVHLSHQAEEHRGREPRELCEGVAFDKGWGVLGQTEIGRHVP